MADITVLYPTDPPKPAAEHMAMLHSAQIRAHFKYMVREVGHARAMQLLMELNLHHEPEPPRPAA